MARIHVLDAAPRAEDVDGLVHQALLFALPLGHKDSAAGHTYPTTVDHENVPLRPVRVRWPGNSRPGRPADEGDSEPAAKTSLTTSCAASRSWPTDRCPSICSLTLRSECPMRSLDQPLPIQQPGPDGGSTQARMFAATSMHAGIKRWTACSRHGDRDGAA